MGTIYSILSTYGPDTVEHSFCGTRPPPWPEVASCCRDGFQLAAHQAVQLEFDYAGKRRRVSSEEGMVYIKRALQALPAGQTKLHVELVVVDRRTGAVVPPGGTVDILVGVHPHYEILAFPFYSPPSLVELKEQARYAAGLDSGATLELFLVDGTGTLVSINTQEKWARVGWTRAKKVFGEGKKGDWQAATFQLEVKSSPPQYTLAPSSAAVPAGSLSPPALGLSRPAACDGTQTTAKEIGAAGQANQR
ncbi:hypothetical protein JCM8097_007737 [Rhodosporidiobolus ruineniae]